MFSRLWMRTCLGLLLGLAAIHFSASGASAFGTTPFIEGDIKVGHVEEAWATVKKVDDKNYLVTVKSDTDEEFTIKAKAKKGLVKDELIKNPVLVKAKVLKINGPKGATLLKILSVRPIPKRVPAKE